jgi:hypothetical protein
LLHKFDVFNLSAFLITQFSAIFVHAIFCMLYKIFSVTLIYNIDLA